MCQIQKLLVSMVMKSPSSNQNIVFVRDRDLPGVEIRYASYEKNAFRDHVHDTYSIALIDQGGTQFVVEDTLYTASAGDIVAINPRQVHACNPIEGLGLIYRMFYIMPQWFLDIAEEIYHPLTSPVRFKAPVINDSELMETWSNFYLSVVNNFDLLEKESRLIESIGKMVSDRCMIVSDDQPDETSGAVALAEAYLSDHIVDKVSLKKLSEVAGLSRYHLLRRFQQEIGLPPHAYQMQLRVDLARSLIMQGQSLTQVAVNSGFSDQSHFSRHFKRFTGATPRQYRSSR